MRLNYNSIKGRVRVGRAAMVLCVIQLDMQGYQCCGTELNVESGPWLVSDFYDALTAFQDAMSVS